MTQRGEVVAVATVFAVIVTKAVGYHELFDVFSSTAKRAKYGNEAAAVARGEAPERVSRRRRARPASER